MAFQVYITPRAARQMEALPKQDRNRIRPKLMELAETPRPPGSKALEASANIYRIRIGDYRATYCIHGDKLLLLVLRVANRREIYDRKGIRGMVKDARQWLADREKEDEDRE